MPFAWRRRHPFTPVGALEGEASFWLLRPKKGQQKFSSKEKNLHRSSQKRSTVALGAGISPEKQSFHLKFGKKNCPPT